MAVLPQGCSQGKLVWQEVKYTTLGLVLVTSRALARIYPHSVYRGARCWLISVLWFEKAFNTTRGFLNKVFH